MAKRDTNPETGKKFTRQEQKQVDRVKQIGYEVGRKHLPKNPPKQS